MQFIQSKNDLAYYIRLVKMICLLYQIGKNDLLIISDWLCLSVSVIGILVIGILVIGILVKSHIGASLLYSR